MILIHFQDTAIKLKKIGKGKFGIVFNYKDKNTGDIVAIKRVQYDISDISLQREVYILSNYHHPTLLKLFGFIDNSEDGEFFLITDFCKNGDLDKMIEKEIIIIMIYW